MDTIDLRVYKRNLRFKKDSKKSVIAWNTDYIVNFEFDEEWEDPKTIRIVNDKDDVICDKLFEGNTVELPKISNTSYIGIGIFCGDLKSTTPLMLSCDKSILDFEGEPLPPSEDVYIQILNSFNSLKNDMTNYATTAYVDESIGNISSVLDTIQNDVDETVELQNAYIGGGTE